VYRGQVSGPTFAGEVARGLPAAVAVACADLDRARRERDLRGRDHVFSFSG